MKKIQKKTILRTKIEYNNEDQEQKQINKKKDFKSNENKNNHQKNPSSKIEVNNPIIQSKRSQNVSNYSENQIQKKYSWQSNENQKYNNQKEVEYLESDLEDSENKIINENDIQRKKNKEIFNNNQGIRNANRRKYPPIDIKDKNKIDDKNKVSNAKVTSTINNNQRRHIIRLIANKEETNNTQKFTNKINDKYNTINNNINNTINNKSGYISKTEIINNTKSGYTTKTESINTQKYTYKINDKNNNVNNNINNNKSGYRYDVQKDNENNNSITASNRRNIHKDTQKKEENKGTSKVRRQTVDKGGKYNNVQFTNIIYSKKNSDFKKPESKELDYEGLKSKYSANIGSTYISQKDYSRNFISKTSLDGINITPKRPNLGKNTQIYKRTDMGKRKDSNQYFNNNNNDKNKTGIYQTKNAADVSAIPRSNYNKTSNYKTERKEDITKNIYSLIDNKNIQKNINSKQQTYNFQNKNNINFNENNNNSKPYNNYNKEIINSSNSETINITNTPIKAFNSNYIKNIGNKNTNNTNINNNRYGNYFHNNSHTINVEQNKNNNKYSITPINLNTEKKTLNNQNTRINNNNSKYLQYPYYNRKKASKEKKNITNEISKENVDNKKSKNVKNYVKTYNNKNLTNDKIKRKEKNIEEVNDIKQKLNKELEKRFLLRRYFKIYKNKVKNDKTKCEYEKWFKRNCENNNDISKKNIVNKYLYIIPSINKNKDIIKQMPYDEWFNRNCEKSENFIKKQNKENEKKLLFNKFNNILNKEDRNNVKINKELRKLNKEEQKEILYSLRNSTKNIDKIIKLDSLIEKCDMEQIEEEKKRLIKSAKDKKTKNILEKLINLWENKENILPKNEKQVKFEELNNLLKSGKKNELIEELNNLDNNDKKDAINYLKLKNKYKSQEIDKLKDLSNRKKRIDVLVNILGGKRNKKFSRKEKLKKIIDNILNLDKKTKIDFVNYMRKTSEDNPKKNEELLSIINELSNEEREEYENLDDDKYNYSYSYSNSYEKNLDISRRNTEEMKEGKNIDSKEEKEKINGGQLIDEKEDFKLLDDDIFEIVNEIQNSQENQKKKLAEDEFKNVSDNIISSLYVNKINNVDDYDENDEDLKVIVNSLNNMNKEDRRKTVDILEINADDEAKKKRLTLLKQRMNSIVNAKKIVKSIINKQEEEERKLEDLADSFLGKLDSNSTIYLNNSSFDSNNINNNNNNNMIKSKEEEKINNLTNMIKSMDINENNFFFDKFRYSGKNFWQNNKLYRLFKTTKMINRIKILRKSDKSWLNSNKTINQNIIKNDTSIAILEEKLKEIIRNFENDLYEENEAPLSRKEIRENEEENNEKLKEISKAIHSMSEEDQNIVLERLRVKANDQYKKSQFIKLFKLVKNIENVKSFVNNIAKGDFNMINIEENKNSLTKNELEEIKNKLIDKLFNDIKDPNDSNFASIEDDNLEKMASMIKNLNNNQQVQILNSIQSKIDSKENEIKFNKFVKKIQYLNKIRKLAKSLDSGKSINKDTIIKNKEISLNNKIELSDEELVSLIEAIINSLFYKIKKEKDMNNLYLSEADEYLIKKEKEKKLENTAKILNKLPKKDREMISCILAIILDNDEQIKDLNLLNKKIGIYKNNEKGENIINIIEDFKNDNIEQLKEDNLAQITEQLITDLLKDYSLDDKNEKIEKLNKSANAISMMNIKDQEKILDTLNNFAKTENQKETMEKLNRLIDNLNYMHFYLYNVNLQHLDKNKKISKDLNVEDFQNFKNSIISQIFNEEELNYDLNKNKNMSKIALKLSTLSNNNQNNILSEINKKSNENGSNINTIKSIDELNEKIKIIKMGNIFSSIFNRKKAQRKKDLGDNEIKLLANNISVVLSKNKSSSNFTEQLLFNHHKQGKIDQFANTLQNYNEEVKRKTINYLTKSILNNNNKKEINKLTSSLMNTNNKNEDSNNTTIFANQFYINSLEQTELNEEELNLLIETFCKDLFTDKIQDINQKEENINLIANIIKELNNENQIKVFDKLSKKPEAKDKLDLIEYLEETVTKLRVLKDELNDEQKDQILIDPNKSMLFNINNEDNGDILENEDDSEKSITVEITIDDIEQDEINELCQVFTVEYVENKPNKKEEKIIQRDRNKSINIMAKSLFKFDNKAQKMITDKLEENCKNENDKKEIKLLKDRINQLNTYKKYAKEIIKKKKGEFQIFEEEIKNIEQENDNSNKNLEKDKLEKLEKEIINNLYNKEPIEFNKNEEVKKYLLEAQKELQIKNSADKIIALAIEDKKIILNKLENLAKNEEKKDTYNKLFKTIENLEKRKKLNDKVKIKEKQIELQDSSNINSTCLSKNKLEIFSQQLEKEIFDENKENYINNYISYKIAEKIAKLEGNNQDSILKNLKEKADNDEKQNRLRELTSLLEKLNNLKKFTQKVREMHINKIALEKIENEKKYGIVILQNEEKEDKSGTILMKKPEELNEDKLNEITKILIEDLNRINEEENDNSDIPYIEKYLKIKDNEKILEKIANVIISLDNNDKTQIVEEIKRNFDNTKINNLYNKFMKILSKKERQFDNEKRRKKKEALKEIEKDKKDNLLYSFIKESNESIFDLYSDKEENISKINEQKQESNKWTHKKGSLETEEIY